MGDSSYADYRWIYNLHTQFIIQGCPSGDTFLVSEGYAEESYQIEQSRHEIFLNDVAAFSGFHSLSHMAPVIINQRVIKFKNQKIYISASQPMFQIPSFTKGLVDSASRFYSRLEDTLKSVKHAQWIDYEEHPDNLLLIAALCNVGRSRVIYRNLRIFFDVDGGISETFDDKYLDYLLSNLRH